MECLLTTKAAPRKAISCQCGGCIDWIGIDKKSKDASENKQSPTFFLSQAVSDGWRIGTTRAAHIW